MTEMDRRTDNLSTYTPPLVPHDTIMRLLRGELRTPHDVLGAHPASLDGVTGVVIRARVPRARQMWVQVRGVREPMELVQDALFVRFLPGETLPLEYRLVVQLVDGDEREFDDPYRFLPTLGDVDLHLYGEGHHLRLWEKLGAHPRVIDGVEGTSFAVWAPNARRVSVIGPFNGWDGRAHPMRLMGGSGVFEIFIPGVQPGDLYKYEIRAPGGATRVKTDPVAFKLEQSPGHASIVERRGVFGWSDADWMARRADANPIAEPMLVYEVHLGSWKRREDGTAFSYRELAPMLAEHVNALGFTHIELLPVLEHPYGGSWGYQVGGYFAPTSRHGSPDDFRFFVDTLHKAGIGVLLDWVPAHFPKDDWALRRFDGTACYEHEDPRLGDHPEWGTHIFNYARHEVRNFLLANALFWIEEFHLDGLRVDAVASMLYLDYGREAGQWLRNRFGGRENLEAVAFLKQLNHAMHTLHPGVMMIAEESTTWPKVTHPIVEGGLGFTFKWNMGWMHDTLDYFKVDPFFRKGAHNKMTFAMMYEYSERFVNPLSHDEVVHMKGSLLRKMPGDEWQRLANLRNLIGYSMTRPGKSLFFMGIELGPWTEWNHDASLDWTLLDDPRRAGLTAFVAAASAVYGAHSCFWKHDHDPSGFSWIDVADKEQSVFSYARFDGAVHAIIVMNMTPVPRDAYRLGAPHAGTYRVALNSDAVEFGGSGYETATSVPTDGEAYHGFPQSLSIALPPLSMLVLLPDPMPDAVTIAAPPATDLLAEVLSVTTAVTTAKMTKATGRAEKNKSTSRTRRRVKAEPDGPVETVAETVAHTPRRARGAKATTVATDNTQPVVSSVELAKAAQKAKAARARERERERAAAERAGKKDTRGEDAGREDTREQRKGKKGKAKTDKPKTDKAIKDKAIKDKPEKVKTKKDKGSKSKDGKRKTPKHEVDPQTASENSEADGVS